jgi:transcriptional regulator with XRE-family HTH domain
MTTSLPEVAAAEVRAEMGRQRMSQAALGELLGRSQPYVWRRLVGEVPFDLAELELIATKLGVPVGRFLRTDAPDAPASTGMAAA